MHFTALHDHLGIDQRGAVYVIGHQIVNEVCATWNQWSLSILQVTTLLWLLVVHCCWFPQFKKTVGTDKMQRYGFNTYDFQPQCCGNWGRMDGSKAPILPALCLLAPRRHTTNYMCNAFTLPEFSQWPPVAFRCSCPSSLLSSATSATHTEFFARSAGCCSSKY